MTREELREKYKNDTDLINYVESLENQVNVDYVKDNLKLKEENEKLKQNNVLLYNQIINGAKRTEETEETPRFKDYSNEIVEALKNK